MKNVSKIEHIMFGTAILGASCFVALILDETNKSWVHRQEEDLSPQTVVSRDFDNNGLQDYSFRTSPTDLGTSITLYAHRNSQGNIYFDNKPSTETLESTDFEKRRVTYQPTHFLKDTGGVRK